MPCGLSRWSYKVGSWVMTRLSPFAAARCSTSNVAIMVTAIPETLASGLPALNVSTVSAVHGIPTCCWMDSTISRAVGRLSCAVPIGCDHSQCCDIPLRPTFHKPSFGLTCRLVLRHSILATLHHETQITVFLKTFHCPFSLTNRSNQPSPHKESQEFPTYCKARSRSALIPGSDKSVMPADFW